MERNIDIDDFSKICRLCLACNNLQPFINLKLLDTFSKITSIQVSIEDKLPGNVCKSCARQLDRISKFIQTCSDNDKFLRDVINKSVQKESSKETPSAEDEIKSESSDDDKNTDTRADQIFRDIKEEEDDGLTVNQNFAAVNLNKDGPVSCEACSQVFSTRLGLLGHFKEFPNCKPEEYTGSENIVKYLDKSESDCKNEDDAEYDGKGHLKGKKMFLCNFCGKNYTRKNGLDRHILSHTGVKPFECRECGKRYITKDTLKTHILTHTGIKAFKCQLCGKNFTQSSHLSYHMKRHQGERPFVCTYCGKCFVSNYHLERHKLMHTGVKPYQCKQCGKQIQYTEDGQGQCSCIESDIEPITDIDFEDTSQESSEGCSDIQPDYESDDLEVSTNKSFEFLFEEEEPATLPYKINCKFAECTDVEYLEDKLDVSEVKIKSDIREQTGGVDFEGASQLTVNHEFKQEVEIANLLYREESKKEVSSGEEFKLEPKMEVIINQIENVGHLSGYDFGQSVNIACSKESNPIKQEKIAYILEHEEVAQSRKEVSSEVDEIEMKFGTGEFLDQTEVKMDPSDRDECKITLGGVKEVTVHHGIKQESLQVCEKNIQKNDMDSAVLESIFQKMLSDSVSVVAKNDPLICDFALEYVKGHNSEIAASKKMRELAKLLIRVKTLEPSVKSLQDILKPKHVNVIICALKILGRFNEKLNKYEKGAPVISVGTSLKHCCEICIKKADLEDIEEFIEMLDILQKRLPRSISTNNTEAKETRIRKELLRGEYVIKTEPNICVVSKQTSDNECHADQPGNNSCIVGGNELTIHHEIKQEKEILHISEKINIESEKMYPLKHNVSQTGSKKGKPYSERPTFCFICKTDVRHFPRHLRIHHPEEPEAKKILSLPVGDKHRKILITKLRKRWNFFDNRATPRPVRKTNNKILPCSNCLGFYTAKFLFCHRRICNGIKTDKKHQAWGQNLLIQHNVDPILVETVFQRMLPDDISFVAKNDSLVCDFALKILKTQKNKRVISQRMRELAKLIIQTKTLEQSVKGLRDILKPKYFDVIISSLKILAKFNDEVGKYQSSGLLQNIGYSLRSCCKIIIADKNLSSEDVQEAKDMLEILQNKWPEKRKPIFKKQKISNVKEKLGIKVRWTEEQKVVVKSFFAEHIKHKKGVKVSECVYIKNQHPTLLANKDWKKIRAFVTNIYRKTPQEEKTKDVSTVEKKLPARSEIPCKAKDANKAKEGIKKIYKNLPDEIEIYERKTVLREEKVFVTEHLAAEKVPVHIDKEDTSSEKNGDKRENVQNITKVSSGGEDVDSRIEETSESEEECDRQDVYPESVGVDNEKAKSDERELVQSSNDNQSTCSYYRENRHFCSICKVEVTNFAEHSERKHPQKPELTQILSSPRKSKRKKLVLSRLRKMCLRSQTKTKDDLPANPNCPGVYSATQLVETVLRKMAPDEVTLVAKNDPLIRKFALDYLKTHKLGNVSILSRKMRELAEFLILLKNYESSVENLRDILKPIYLYVIIDTLKIMGKFDDKLERLGNSLLVSSIRESLTDCCEIVIKDEELTPDKAYECKDLLDILKTKWPKFVPINDLEEVAKREEPSLTQQEKLYPDMLANKNWKDIKELVQNTCKKVPESREIHNRKYTLRSFEKDNENNSIDLTSNIEDDHHIREVLSSGREVDNLTDISPRAHVYSTKDVPSDKDEADNGEKISPGVKVLQNWKEEFSLKKDVDIVLENYKPIHEEVRSSYCDGVQTEYDSIFEGAEFEIKQENDIDIFEHEIEPEVPTSGKTSRNFCFICKVHVLNFARHLQRHHPQEPELRQIISLPRGSRRRKMLLTKVRKKWNFLSREVKGQKKTKAKLLPCTNCFGYYSAKFLYKHRKNCNGGTSDRKHQAAGQNLLVTHAVDPLLVETVFRRMLADDVSLVAKNDPLICKFALDYLKTHKPSIVSRKMRELAKFLTLVKSFEPSVINLRDILKSIHFDVIISAIKILGKFDDALNRFENLILVGSIGCSLRDCCKMIIQSKDSSPEETDALKKMLDNLRINWPTFVSTKEKVVKPMKLHRNRNRTPWTGKQKEVVKLYFTEHIKHKKAVRAHECTELKNMYPDLLANKDWKKIKVFVQNIYKNMPQSRDIQNRKDIFISYERDKENNKIDVASHVEYDYDIKDVPSGREVDSMMYAYPKTDVNSIEDILADRDEVDNGEELSSGLKVLQNWKEEFSEKKDVNMILENFEPIQKEVRPLYCDGVQAEYDSIFEGAEFEIKQENDIIDNFEHEIEPEVTTSRRIQIRMRHFCFICKVHVLNFARHIQRHHSQEPELRQIMSLPHGSRRRKLLLTKVRKKWNFLSREVRGQKKTKAKLLPCTNCFGYYSAKLLYKHRKVCNGGTSDRKHQVSGQNLLVTNAVDPLLVETVFRRMLADDVSLVAKNDPLICKFAVDYLKTHKPSIVSRKMRELAKFLTLVKSFEPSVINLSDILKPIHFDLIIRAIKILGKFDDTLDRFEKAILVASIGFSLKYCCKMIIQSKDSSPEESDALKKMLDILQINWPKFISTKEKDVRTMKLYRNRTHIPWTEKQKEVVKLYFTEHIKQKKSVKERECTELKNMYPDLLANKDWKKIKVFVQNIYKNTPEIEDNNHNDKEACPKAIHDGKELSVVEASVPEASFAGSGNEHNPKLSPRTENSSRMEENLTAANEVRCRSDLSSRLEEINSRVEAFLRKDVCKRKKISFRTEVSPEEQVDNRKELPYVEEAFPETTVVAAREDSDPKEELSFEELEVPTNTCISLIGHIDNTKKVLNCVNKKKSRTLIPWTDEQKQVVKTFFADHIMRKQAVKQYECSDLKNQYPELLANKDWKKIKVYVQNLYTKKAR